MTVLGGSLNPDGSHSFPVRVYFEDTDFSTNVYHAAYLKFCERARTEFLRAHGVHHAELAGEGLAFAVREMSLSYERTAHIDDLLEVVTALIEMRGARLVLEQTIRRRDTLICRAKVTVVLLTLAGRPVRMPQALRARFPAV